MNQYPKILCLEKVLIGLIFINIFVPVPSEILAQIITPIIFADTETFTYF